MLLVLEMPALTLANPSGKDLQMIVANRAALRTTAMSHLDCSSLELSPAPRGLNT